LASVILTLIGQRGPTAEPALRCLAVELLIVLDFFAALQYGGVPGSDLSEVAFQQVWL